VVATALARASSGISSPLPRDPAREALDALLDHLLDGLVEVPPLREAALAELLPSPLVAFSLGEDHREVPGGKPDLGEAPGRSLLGRAGGGLRGQGPVEDRLGREGPLGPRLGVALEQGPDEGRDPGAELRADLGEGTGVSLELVLERGPSARGASKGPWPVAAKWRVAPRP
jgi:hypothetical protein